MFGYYFFKYSLTLSSPSEIPIVYILMVSLSILFCFYSSDNLIDQSSASLTPLSPSGEFFVILFSLIPFIISIFSWVFSICSYILLAFFGYLNLFKMFNLKSLSGEFKVCSSSEIISPVNGPYFRFIACFIFFVGDWIF